MNQSNLLVEYTIRILMKVKSQFLDSSSSGLFTGLIHTNGEMKKKLLQPSGLSCLKSTIARTDLLSPKWSPNNKIAFFTIAILAIVVVNNYSPDRFTIAFATGLWVFLISGFKMCLELLFPSTLLHFIHVFSIHLHTSHDFRIVLTERIIVPGKRL